FSAAVVNLEIPLEYEEETIKELEKYDFISFLYTLNHRYNVYVFVYGIDYQDLLNNVSVILENSKYLDYEFMVLEKLFETTPADSFDINIDTKIRKKIKSKELYNYDIKDIKILDCISIDSRKSLVNIAKETNLGVDLVKNRLKKLEQNSVILNYWYFYSFLAFEFQTYNIMFKLKTFSIRDKLIKYFDDSKISNTLELYKSDYSITVSIQTKNRIQLINFIKSLQKNFGKYILRYDIREMKDQYLGNYFPKYFLRKLNLEKD
ncbi:MAG: winged helix-turn-helix transcriptional regulator, partial [archaeon]